MKSDLYLGLDLGTSGCRVVAIDAHGVVHGHAALTYAVPSRAGVNVEQDPAIWWQGTVEVIHTLLRQIDTRQVRALAVDATSGTILLADAHGHPLTPALMYNDGRAVNEARALTLHAPRNSAAHGTASGLAKLLWLQRHTDTAQVRHALHHADWIVGRLCGRYDITDANNAVKTGYDAQAARWPTWLRTIGLNTQWLPQVVAPGTRIGTITLQAALELGLPPTTQIVAGTSDSTAAIIATGANLIGDAVTSLGSTLVVKVISAQPVFAPEYGVYSQPLGTLWLVGGGSNSGGGVLRSFFSDAQMAAMTPHLNPAASTGLNYYPLLSPGERFPHNDPHYIPRVTPRPTNDITFFQGLLEGIAHIEQSGYQLLAALGAPKPTCVRSVGGGAQNKAWTQLRAHLLEIPMLTPEHQDAAYGAAQLALRGAR
ncbi:MAG: FGGY-family carbohydrate kinase [Gammaproteobacteria bacterium]|nr:FGGY-family carbohydrate kinase [Gammaproteobacteria bacterium]